MATAGPWLAIPGWFLAFWLGGAEPSRAGGARQPQPLPAARPRAVPSRAEPCRDSGSGALRWVRGLSSGWSGGKSRAPAALPLPWRCRPPGGLRGFNRAGRGRGRTGCAQSGCGDARFLPCLLKVGCPPGLVCFTPSGLFFWGLLEPRAGFSSAPQLLGGELGNWIPGNQRLAPRHSQCWVAAGISFTCPSGAGLMASPHPAVPGCCGQGEPRGNPPMELCGVAASPSRARDSGFSSPAAG